LCGVKKNTTTGFLFFSHKVFSNFELLKKFAFKRIEFDILNYRNKEEIEKREHFFQLKSFDEFAS